jgi:hypothetical protein
VNNTRSLFSILFFSYPIALKSCQSGQNRSSNPNRKLPFIWSKNLQIHVIRYQTGYFLMQSLSVLRKHCASSRKRYILKQQMLQVNISLINTVNYLLLNSINIHSHHLRPEHYLRSSYWKISYLNLSSIREFVVLFLIVIG